VADSYLPAPSNYALRRSSGVFESAPNVRRMHLIDQPDSDVLVDVILLTWQNVSHAAAAAIFEHYEEFAAGTFNIHWPNLPEVAEVPLHVRWLTPPVINTQTPTTASVTGEVETVLAFQNP
jgi:hypothetical protein